LDRLCEMIAFGSRARIIACGCKAARRRFPAHFPALTGRDITCPVPLFADVFQKFMQIVIWKEPQTWMPGFVDEREFLGAQ